ncbi:Uncharacterised protein [uncultured archaeon]|nr:Uncharacterised protein [uncultured archaeon]
MEPAKLMLGRYADTYRLNLHSINICQRERPTLDINRTGLLMHGNELDPTSVLEYGLLPRRTPYTKTLRSPFQVCLGLNNTNPDQTILTHGAIKNTAVKYAGYFNRRGVIYVVHDEVKEYKSYYEEWENLGGYSRGLAWVEQRIPVALIRGVVTCNLSLAAASMIHTNCFLPMYTPDGNEYVIVRG